MEPACTLSSDLNLEHSSKLMKVKDVIIQHQVMFKSILSIKGFDKLFKVFHPLHEEVPCQSVKLKHGLDL